MKSFNGKVAAITGAGSGMGRELAYELAQAGCALSLSDVNEKGLEETAAKAREYGVNVTAQRVDVAKRDEIYAWAKKTRDDHGKVNLIFNNAGVALNSPLATITQDEFEWIVNINFWGVVNGTQAFLPYLQEAGEGHIINTSSLFGLIGTPGTGAYSATKFAVRGYTESLRIELDMMNCGVSCTCVHPGGIRTAINQQARVGKDVEKVLGMNPDVAREKFDKLLNTTSANKAAKIILGAVKRDARRVVVGPDAKAMDIVVRALGSLYQPLVTANMRRMLKSS
jgi:short-subunit dehydrogenase